MPTNFQNLFAVYATDADYVSALDNQLKVDENQWLIPNTSNTQSNAGTWQYGGPGGVKATYTIGYGYDFRAQNGTQIISDFQTASISLSAGQMGAQGRRQRAVVVRNRAANKNYYAP